jgi:hypothetical protein
MEFDGITIPRYFIKFFNLTQGRCTVDPFEEFEFKPLTDGLGFHKNKKKTPENSAIKTAPKTNGTTQETPSATSKVFTSPLPRTEAPIAKTIIPPLPSKKPSEVDQILNNLKTRKLDFVADKTKPKELVWIKTIPSAESIILDSMLIFAANLICLIALINVTKINLYKNIMNPDENYLIYIALAGQFAVMSWIYLVATRMFLGSTPGESVFEEQLGTPAENQKWNYMLKVVWRSTLVLLTGFIILPILSFIFKTDLTGKISGLSIYKKDFSSL